MARGEESAPRRSRRGEVVEKPMKYPAASQPEDSEVLEDDITRCICGHADYPGPSLSIKDQFGPAAIQEDMGNFFVQCDQCHVWQHGGCLGIHDESIIPDEYFCEKCKPEFHKVIKPTSLNARSSNYLPVLEGAKRNTSLTAADQAKLKELKTKALQSTKRRATMNSRGAYDEDEMLRQAIEESKQDGTLGKRNREDSEDRRPSNKRQRTDSSNTEASKSPSPDGDKVVLGKNGTKLRGAAARNNREKELREKQKQDAAAQRADAASKRNARSERRRADDSPPPTPGLSPSKGAETKTSKVKGDTPQPGKAKMRGGSRKRVGRNQYTRSREEVDTPRRSDSHDRNGRGSPYGNGESTRAKPKIHPGRTSLNEMKKRVAAILEFVSQMQAQQNKSNSSNPHSNSGSDTRSSSSGKGDSTPSLHSAFANMPSSKLIEAVTAGLQDSTEEGKRNFMPDLDFAKMASGQMMETLIGELMIWQNQYGIYSR